MTKEELLDTFAIEAMKAITHQGGAANVASHAYDVAEKMLDRRQEVLDKWALKDEIRVDGIDKLELTVRSQNCLKAEEIYTIKHLITYTENCLLKIPNLGSKSVKEIIERLEDRGLKLWGQA
jgi:DNA-directed RNA polymerase subunit alpha